MAGGKGKSTGGKAGPKEVTGKSQKSHSAKAGLQVRRLFVFELGSAVAGSVTSVGQQQAKARRGKMTESFQQHKSRA